MDAPRFPPAHEILREIVGDDVFGRILEELGGSRIYLPQTDHRSRTRRILREYRDLTADGVTPAVAIKRISHQEGMTRRQVRRIVVRTFLV